MTQCKNLSFQGSHFADIQALLSAHLDHLGRDLSLRLRRLDHAHVSGRHAHPFLLLRVVLRLRNPEKSPELRESFRTTLSKLDFSCFHPDQEFTTAILKIVLTFVTTFEREELEVRVKGEEEAQWEQRNKERGALTEFVKGISIYFA